MTTQEVKYHCDLVIKLLEARKEGKTIQCLAAEWSDLPEDMFEFFPECYVYRIKSEPRELWLARYKSPDNYIWHTATEFEQTGNTRPDFEYMKVREIV